MRHPIPFACSLLVLAAASCAPTPPQAKPIAPQDFAYKVAPERVWNALLLVYTDLNIPIENMDKASWFMRSREMLLQNADRIAWMDCGSGGPKGVSVRVMVTTLLRPSADTTLMRLNLHVEATRMASGSLVPDHVHQSRSARAADRRVGAAAPLAARPALAPRPVGWAPIGAGTQCPRRESNSHAVAGTGF